MSEGSVASTSALAKPMNIFSSAVSNSIIKEKTFLIVYINRESMLPCTVTPGQTTNTRYGTYRHDEMIGLRFGTRMPSSRGPGYCYLLRPTPELWSQSLPHRTQILYMPDIAYITSYLDIKPGSRVIEAGTGSGSFSHAVARTIGSKGKLFSYEFHEPRYEQAKEEFMSHGLSDIIELRHRNVCKDGFAGAEDVDAILLDVPAPWEALEAAKNTLAKDRIARICCFSPCIEQVIRTVGALHEHGFSQVTMYETLLRQHDLAQYTMPTIEDTIEKLKVIEERKQQRRDLQIAENKAAREAAAREAAGQIPSADVADSEMTSRNTDAMQGMKSETVASAEVSEAGLKRTAEEAGLQDDNTEPEGKRTKDDGTASALTTDVETSAAPSPAPMSAASTPKTTNGTYKAPGEQKVSTVKPALQIRGHTSYLTFAFLVPAAPSATEDADKGVEMIPMENGTEVVEPQLTAGGESFAKEYAAIASQDLANIPV